MKRYRSGHNGTASKADDYLLDGSWVRIPLSSPKGRNNEKRKKRENKNSNHSFFNSNSFCHNYYSNAKV